MTDTIESLRAEVARLREWRESLPIILLEWRGIDSVDSACHGCSGSGVKAYGSTSTWRGGAGGQMITSGVCDECWGSGKRGQHWFSHRLAMSLAADRDHWKAEAERLRVFITRIANQPDSRPDYWSTCAQCQRNRDAADELLEQPK